MEDRLVSRFGWGIIVDISKPDFETRVAILQKKQDELGAVVDYKILEYIAENIETNIRDPWQLQLLVQNQITDHL